MSDRTISVSGGGKSAMLKRKICVTDRENSQGWQGKSE